MDDEIDVDEPIEVETPEFGTDSHYLHQSNAIDTSVAAAKQVNTTKMERIALNIINIFGEAGCTGPQVDEIYSGKTSLQPRFRALLDRGEIFDTGIRVEGETKRKLRVVAAIKHYTPEKFPNRKYVKPKLCPNCMELLHRKESQYVKMDNDGFLILDESGDGLY